MDQCTPQTPFCSTTTANWHQWSTSNEATFSSTSFSWDINSNLQQVPTQGNQSDLIWVTWQAQTQNQWAESNLPKSCPSSTRTGRSCESRTGVGGHRAALKNSPATPHFFPWTVSPALASPMRWHKEVQGTGSTLTPVPQQHPTSAVLTSPGAAGYGKPLCCRERGNYTLPH